MVSAASREAAGTARSFLCPLGRQETGGKAALPMWIDYMRAALAGVEQRKIEPPSGLVTVRRSTDEENERISLEDRDYVRQRLWLQLEIAHLSLMRRDQEAFRQSLVRVEQTLSTWFEHSHSEYQSVWSQLEKEPFPPSFGKRARDDIAQTPHRTYAGAPHNLDGGHTDEYALHDSPSQADEGDKQEQAER